MSLGALHPTLITPETYTLIENIFVNNVLESNIQSGSILSLVTDHLLQFCIISDFIFDYKYLSHFAYDYSHLNANKFLAGHAQLDTAFFTEESFGLDDKFDHF